jgi:hypothetical protein
MERIHARPCRTASDWNPGPDWRELSDHQSVPLIASSAKGPAQSLGLRLESRRMSFEATSTWGFDQIPSSKRPPGPDRTGAFARTTPAPLAQQDVRCAQWAARASPSVDTPRDSAETPRLKKAQAVPSRPPGCSPRLDHAELTRVESESLHWNFVELGTPTSSIHRGRRSLPRQSAGIA